MAFPTGPQAAEAADPVLFSSLGQEIIQRPGTEEADAKNIHKDFLSSFCCVLGGDKGARTVPSLKLHSKMQLVGGELHCQYQVTALHISFPGIGISFPGIGMGGRWDTHSQIFNHLL